MGWEVTASEVGGLLTEVEQTLAQAMRWAEARLDSVDEDERQSVEEEIEALATEAYRLEGIGSYAAEIRGLQEKAQRRFEEMDAQECPDCGESFPHASHEDWNDHEGRCEGCVEAESDALAGEDE